MSEQNMSHITGICAIAQCNLACLHRLTYEKAVADISSAAAPQQRRIIFLNSSRRSQPELLFLSDISRKNSQVTKHT